MSDKPDEPEQSAESQVNTRPTGYQVAITRDQR
jgi:hypothetical protein